MRVEPGTPVQIGLNDFQTQDNAVRQTVETRAANQQESQDASQTPNLAGQRENAVASSTDLPRDMSLKFNVSDDSSQVQVEIVDKDNGKVVQKIPSDAVMKLHASFRKTGMFMDRSL